MRREALKQSELISSMGWRDGIFEIRYRDAGAVFVYFSVPFQGSVQVQADFVTFVPSKILPMFWACSALYLLQKVFRAEWDQIQN